MSTEDLLRWGYLSPLAGHCGLNGWWSYIYARHPLSSNRSFPLLRSSTASESSKLQLAPSLMPLFPTPRVWINLNSTTSLKNLHFHAPPLITMTTAALLRLRIPSRTPAHTLRALCIVTFPFAFVFLLVHGIVSKHVVPAIGLVPMFLSVIYSAFLLYNDKTFGGDAGVLSGTPLHLLLDLMLACGLLAVLILSWIFVPRGYSRNYWDSRQGGWVMFGTYATVWMMVNW